MKQFVEDDPEESLQAITRDLVGRLRIQGVRTHSIEGIEIVLKIAFALGEKNAALKIGGLKT